MAKFKLWKERVRNRFWVVPALSVAVAVVGGVLLPRLDRSLTLPDALAFTAGADTARTTLQLIATMAVSVAGISFSVIVVALVLAAQQLSPRVLQGFQRHALNQSVLGVFLGTAAFSLYVLSAVEDRGPDPVPEFSIAVAMLMAGISLVLFVFFLHHIVRSLNASTVIRRIAADGHQAVLSPYPHGVGSEPESDVDAEAAVEELISGLERAEVRAPRAGYLASVKALDLIEAAERAGGFVHQHAVIGQFVMTGAVVAEAWAAAGDLEELTEDAHRAFVFNEERVVDDDVAFPLRQLTDVALKGLSPGVNDPTTAENAMDSVTDSLVRLARQVPAAKLRLSETGDPRLRAAALGLDDLVRLGFDQVRRDAASRPSFAVRLLELLADLRATGGERAEACDEIDRQALLISEDAGARAEVGADRILIQDAYRRLHQSDQARPLAVPARATDS